MADIKNLLLRAQHEILDLRRHNEVLQAKVDTMDLFALVLRTTPAHQTIGMGEDVAWLIDKEIQEINRREAATPETREGAPRSDS
jgi:hypothetical protein